MSETGLSGITNSGTMTNARIEMYLPSRATTCAELSNRFADEAVEWGVRGKLITAERCAELAEVYAMLGLFYQMADAIRGRA